MKQIVNKKCIKCLEVKDISLFYCRKKGSKDGHYNYCKDCHNGINKISSEKWRKSEQGKIYFKKYSSVYRRQDKWKDYNKKYARLYQKSEKGLAQRRIIDKRKRENPKFRVDSNFSRAIRLALNGNKNRQSWRKLVGYSLKDLIKHLEALFDNKMTWENYGSYWHIDHILPRSSFKYISASEDGFKKCWALENLQPLEAIANIRKSNKIYEANC